MRRELWVAPHLGKYHIFRIGHCRQRAQTLRIHICVHAAVEKKKKGTDSIGTKNACRQSIVKGKKPGKLISDEITIIVVVPKHTLKFRIVFDKCTSPIPKVRRNITTTLPGLENDSLKSLRY